MRFEKTYIPYGVYWTTPFCKWQGSFAGLHPIRFAADVARRALAERNVSPETFSALHLGNTIPAPSSFYGAPWLAGLIGAEGISGPTVNQACATSARLLAGAAGEVEASNGTPPAVLCIAADRTSNGPHLVYPDSAGPGARPISEDWVWDNFQCDPFARNSMIETAENVARQEGISTEAQHDVVLLRHAQYRQALEDGAAFHRRFMVAPLEVNPTGKKVVGTVSEDEGVFPTTAEGLRRLKPVQAEGTVTFGGQTYPADGNAGIVLTTQGRAREMSRDPAIEVRLTAFGQGRAKPGYMPQANLPASRQALAEAGIGVGDLAAVKTHNPFAVNDISFSNGMGIPLERMNNYGSSLIWGHPQGPTGMRLVIELIEELVLRGGGYGLFSGCAAGDSAAALIVQVTGAN